MPLGDGLRCAGGSVIRLVIRAASAGVVEFGHGVATDPPVSQAGAIPASGATRVYQAWYRDAQTFCTSATYNLTNALEVRWAP